MSKRTQRRAEQRRNNKLNREQPAATGAARPTTPAEAQSAQQAPLNTPETKAPTTARSSAGASPAQIAANRENATHSTGPTSEAGKATVSQNRTVHGLNYNPNTFRVLACEDQAQYDALQNELTTDHKPTGTTETILVKTMAQHRWLLDRANRLQETCFNQQTGEITDQKLFTLYLRYATTHERAFHKCLTDLLKLRATTQKLQIGFESQKRQADRHRHFLDSQEFDLQLKQTKFHMAQHHLFRAQTQAKWEDKAQNAA